MTLRTFTLFCGWDDEVVVVQSTTRKAFFDALEVVVRRIIRTYPGFKFGPLENEEVEVVKNNVDDIWREEKLTNEIVRETIPRQVIRHFGVVGQIRKS